MRFISFDIGVKNMAFCEVLLHPDGIYTARRLELHQIPSLGGPIYVTAEACAQWLKDNFKNLEMPATVLIEQQMTQNYMCFALSYTVQSYFITQYGRGVKVIFVPADIKPLPHVLEGKQRKGAQAKNWLLDRLATCFTKESADACAKVIRGSAKTDDLCDCILQWMGYMDSLKPETKALFLAHARSKQK